MRLPKAPLYLRLAIVVAAVASAPRANADVQAFRQANACITTGGTGAGAAAWTNPDSASANPMTIATEATASIPGSGSSQYLACSDFRFTVPAGSVIDAVTMRATHRQTGGAIADAHVYPVLPGGTIIGSAGSDRARTNCMTETWTNTANAISYANPALPPWGVALGACAAAATTCPSPAGSFNVNHPGFGAAIAAKNCTGGGATARVDTVEMEVAFTIPPCGTTAWGPITVAVSPKAPNVNATYTITTTIPNDAGCALRPGSFFVIDLPAGVDATQITTATIAADSGPAMPIPSIIKSGEIASLQIPAAAATQPCGTAQCIPPGAQLTVVVNNVPNPATEGDHTLDVKATGVLAPAGGTTATSTSAPFRIARPCVPTGASASQWGTTSVSVTNPDKSMPPDASNPGDVRPACPRFSTYRIETITPSELGCELSSSSELVVTFPTSAVDTDARTITAARVNGAIVPLPLTPAPTASEVRLHPTANVPPSTTLTIELDMVQNSSVAASHMLTFQATGAANGSTAPGSGTYTIASGASGCTPPLDFYVRDWTTSATVKDEGGPVPPQAPGPDWAKTSDVWNQYSTTAPAIPADDWVRGFHLAIAETNHAFARISLKTPSPTPVPKRPVRARFYVAPYGTGVPFALAGETTADLSSPAVTPGPFVHVPIPASLIPAVGLHACLAVEIVSRDDGLTQPSIAGQLVGTTDNAVAADPNMAQRNLGNVVMNATPLDPPPPPPAPPMGPMSGFALIHNDASRARDMTLRVDVPREALQHLRDAKLAVVGGGEPIRLEPGASITLPRMLPSEDRWLELGFGLESGAEGTMLPVTMHLMNGDKPVGEFTWGIRPSPVSDVIRENLTLHRDTFARLAIVARSGEAKSESAAAARLLEEQADVSEAAYAAFLKQHARPMAATIAGFLHGDAAHDAFQLTPAQERLQNSLRQDDPRFVTTAHLALLERLEAAQTMRVLGGGNPAGIIGMVRWQKDVYSNVPALAQLPGAAELVKESQRYIDGYAGTPQDGKDYAALLAKSQKLFQATAAAVKKDGIDQGPALAALERQRKSGDTAALQKAHRDYLLALEPLRSSGDPSQQRGGKGSP